MVPILKFLSDQNEHKTSEIVAHISDAFELTDEERRQLIPSGRAKLISNRVGWACTYLRKAGLIQSRRRGINQITDEGMSVVQQNPTKIDSNFLSQYEAFQNFKLVTKSSGESSVPSQDSSEEKTPEEIIGLQAELVQDSLQKDLLEQVSEMEPELFEQLVIDLLIAMGYGGSAQEAGRAIGQTNDGGIDGIINEDVLGLDTIYVQAKRWSNAVPVKEVRDFAGALLSKRSNKGVFITTSSFPKSAEEFVSSIDRRITLIDGDTLARLMIKYNLGVSIKETIELKEIDSDYFTT
jgi:restriction system protein